MKTRQEMMARVEAKMDVNLKEMKEERMERLETMIQQHKGPRCNLAATSEDGDDNQQWHHRTK
jgi:hypothetical protein